MPEIVETKFEIAGLRVALTTATTPMETRITRAYSIAAAPDSSDANWERRLFIIELH